MPRYFNSELRGLLLDEMPHLIIRLPMQSRNVLLALYFDGKSYREYAEEQDVSYETVRQWRNKALAEVKAMYLGEDDDGTA